MSLDNMKRVTIPTSVFYDQSWTSDSFSLSRCLVDIFVLTSQSKTTTLTIDFLKKRWGASEKDVISILSHTTLKREIDIQENFAGVVTFTRTFNDSKKTVKKDLTRAEIFSSKAIDLFNKTFNKKYKKYQQSDIKNIDYWLDIYTEEEILEAIKKSRFDEWWKDRINPAIYFRKKTTSGDAVDYIGKFLNLKTTGSFEGMLAKKGLL